MQGVGKLNFITNFLQWLCDYLPKPRCFAALGYLIQMGEWRLSINQFSMGRP